jgi:NTP pyrophosphatase (non-canonical NTP hydrolase)
MKYSRATAGRMQLDLYVAVISKVYSKQDRNRSIWDIWCHALHHGAAVAERIRRGAPAVELMQEIADFTLWLLTAVHKLTGKFGESRRNPGETSVEPFIRIRSTCSDLLWHKYPRICPSCYGRRTEGGRRRRKSFDLRTVCDCLVHDAYPQDKDAWIRTTSALLSFSEKIRGEKPQSIDEWQEMFRTIFKANLTHLSLQDIALHLLEEMGEASDAMVRMYTYKKDKLFQEEVARRQLRLESEIADLFSWLFALVEKINIVNRKGIAYEQWRTETKSRSVHPIYLSQIIWRRYGSDKHRSFHCPFCGSVVCSCKLVFVPATGSIEGLVRKLPVIATGRKDNRA